MDKILNYDKNQYEDYYSILGCHQDSSMEQIALEYKLKALKYHPDKNHQDEESGLGEAKIGNSSANTDIFCSLTKAKDVLCDVEKRRCYDKWLRSGMAMSFEQYMSLGSQVHHSMHWIGKKMTEPMVMCQKDWHDKHCDQNTVQTQCDKVEWKRDGSDVLNKFRNYQI